MHVARQPDDVIGVVNLLREKAPIIGEPLLHEVVPLKTFAGRADHLLELAEGAKPELRVFGPALRRLADPLRLVVEVAFLRRTAGPAARRTAEPAADTSRHLPQGLDCSGRKAEELPKGRERSVRPLAASGVAGGDARLQVPTRVGALLAPQTKQHQLHRQGGEVEAYIRQLVPLRTVHNPTFVRSNIFL